MRILDAIEDGHRRRGHHLPDEELATFRLLPRDSHRCRGLEALFPTHRNRTFVGLSLMVAQAFFYNAVFFTYALVLTDFYDMEFSQVGWYLLPFAVGNFLGPLLLGRLFDTVGRRPMIATTYALSGLLLGLVVPCLRLAFSRQLGKRSRGQSFLLCSAAASSAYLTVSETFPLRSERWQSRSSMPWAPVRGWRAMVVRRPDRQRVAGELFAGYLLGSTLMVAAALIALRFGVNAERMPLEAVATPLSATD